MSMPSPFIVLQDSSKGTRTHTHESFSEAKALEQRLRSTVRGEVRFDRVSRALYSTDASNYRQVPIGLVVPRDIEDVVVTVAACHEFGAPVLSRGAGTSLAGQCCNAAVVLDFSKH
jgi:FAD/FMN-containing dehydrogenase